MPAFTSITTSFTVTDFVGRIERNEFIVNRDYQRSDSVWPAAARSFLIESILLGYPIPKLSIRQMTDVVTRTTTSEIVDGQQRTKAIVDFFNNRFALSRNSEVEGAGGCRYDALPEELKQQFISFSIQADVLSGARDEEIIELFRRINSHTITLNKEEQRHARFQGGMKWLVYKIAKESATQFEALQIFKVKQFARMADVKLIAEVIHALMFGVSTTNAKKLDALYSQNNGAPDVESDVYFEPRPDPKIEGRFYPGSQDIAARFQSAMAALGEMHAIAGTAITKPYSVYSLLLALMHAENPVDVLTDSYAGGRGLASADVREQRLLELAQIMELEDDEKPEPGIARDLWTASSKSTNTAEHRLVRFGAFLEAVSR